MRSLKQHIDLTVASMVLEVLSLPLALADQSCKEAAGKPRPSYAVLFSWVCVTSPRCDPKVQ